MDRLVDHYLFTLSLINATYDFHTFSSTGYVQVGEKLVKRTGYVQVGEKWVKKDTIKARAESP